MADRMSTVDLRVPGFWGRSGKIYRSIREVHPWLPEGGVTSRRDAPADFAVVRRSRRGAVPRPRYCSSRCWSRWLFRLGAGCLVGTSAQRDLRRSSAEQVGGQYQREVPCLPARTLLDGGRPAEIIHPAAAPVSQSGTDHRSSTEPWKCPLAESDGFQISPEPTGGDAGGRSGFEHLICMFPHR